MQMLTSNLGVNNTVSSVSRRKRETPTVGRYHKSRKDKPQRSVLINVSHKMLERDTEKFSDLFDKYRHIYG